MTTDAIKVDGLKQFSRNIKKIDRDLGRATRLALNEAAQVVVNDAVPSIPRRSGKAANTVKAKSTQTKARVSGGSARVPYYAWLDFGGQAGRATRQFRKKGRYIYVAYFRSRDSGRFEETMSSALIKVVESAGIEVN